MNKHEELNIQSELLKKHWDLIGETYVVAKEKYKVCFSNNTDEMNWKYQKIFDFLVEKWKDIYPKFVLIPIENQVFEMFYKIQTKGFEKEKNISEEIDKFSVYYYLCQYFYLFVIPSLRDNYTYEDYPRFEIKTDNQNLLLREIFSELWYELTGNDEEFEEFDDLDLEEFNDIEFFLLSSFLTKCWNETKTKTGTKVIAILSEATNVGENYFLDENRVLSDIELEEIINKN
ncbi:MULTISPECIES: hypothetical protein [unclassified Myroides]|uniref:hypothetical protein n=1 Tax=unclassified Myroides TaxID=2642485 RepID=UPI003D2F8C5F